MVLFEGLIVSVIALLSCFWISFGLDYLPVKFGFNELSATSRIILLSAVVVFVMFQLFRLIGRRLFVSMRDRSMALLVEKKYPQFEESLITTVDAANRATDSNSGVDHSMIELTKKKAESILKEVRLASIVSYSFLQKSAIVAGVLVLSIGGFAVSKLENLDLAARRIYLIDGQPWPRRVYMELVGMKIKVDVPVQGIAEVGQTLSPNGNTFRIATGSSATLIVRARSSDPLVPWRQLPSSCQMRYRSSDGNRGTQVLNRVGKPKDGWQTYTLNGSPLQGILADMRFELRGDDFRSETYRIEIVDQPIVTETELDCEFPEYLSRKESLSWTPRTIRWTGRSELPKGTRFTIRGSSNKPLSKVYAWNLSTKTMTQGSVTGEQFEFAVPQLEEAARFHIYLVDSDTIVSDSPHAIFVEPIVDQAPEVITRLVGIGSAVTPNAILPLKGQVIDDYQVQKTWIELSTPERTLPVEYQSLSAKGELDSSIDLAELVRAGLKLTVDDGSELELVTKANDYFSLEDESFNVGVGDKYTLELVSPNRLLRMLERLEVGERRRLEQIFEEVSNIRGYLSRTRNAAVEDTDNDSEPGEVEPGDARNDWQRKQAMRIVFGQRSSLQASKSAQEIKAVASAFENLRLQLINNRIDAKDRNERLEKSIVAPLRAIPSGPLKQLSAMIAKLNDNLKQIDKGMGDDRTESAASELTDKALLKTDEVLKEIDAVLAMLVKYESQNELLEIVRRLIAEQEALMKKTRDKQQQDAFEGLLDD